MRHKKLRVYLSGGMEYAKDEGLDWRNEMEGWIKEHLGHKVFTPNVESEKYLAKVIPNENFRLLKSTKIDIYLNIVQHFVQEDSKEIAIRSDYVICYWDASAQRGAGTKGEMTIAHYFKKPVYMVTNMSIEEIPGWVLGCTTKRFQTFEQLKLFLSKKYST